SLGRYTIQSPLGAAAELFSRSRPGGMIDHVFGELDRTAGLGLDCEGNLSEIFGVDNLIGVRARGLQRIFGDTCQGQAALFGRMAQHDATVFRIVGPVMENST